MKSPHANKNPNPKQRVTQKNVKANCATIIYDAARRNVGFKVGANLCWRLYWSGGAFLWRRTGDSWAIKGWAYKKFYALRSMDNS